MFVYLLLSIGLLPQITSPAKQTRLQLPPVPPAETFLNDYTGIILGRYQADIAQAQQKAFEEHDTPIIVVAIGLQAQYGGAAMSIEQFAQSWFNHWQIGKIGADNELINRGILLLVSLGDRKARIELGAEWGHRWDAHCQQIMDRVIIPHFKDGNYSAGIARGVQSLYEMARLGPTANPTTISGPRTQFDLGKPPISGNPLPLWIVIGGCLLGIGLIVASFFVSDDQQRTVLTLGLFVLGIAIFFWFILVFLAIAPRFIQRDDDSFFGQIFDGGGGGGGFSGGGFGGGGFSGGGGASGSW